MIGFRQIQVVAGIFSIIAGSAGHAEVQKAIAKIESINGIVRQVSRDSNALEVDFQFADKSLLDEHIDAVLSLPDVTHLRLKSTTLSDSQLARLSKLRSLKILHIDQTAISDDGLKHFENHPSLEVVNLYQTSVSDNSLPILQSLTSLKKLNLAQTKITNSGIAQLQVSRPELRIWPDLELEKVRLTTIYHVSKESLDNAATKLKIAEKDFEELHPRVEELKKEYEATKKDLDPVRKERDTLRKKSDESRRKQDELKRKLQEVKRRAEKNPSDEPLKKEITKIESLTLEAEKLHQELLENYNAVEVLTKQLEESFRSKEKEYRKAESAKKELESAKILHEAALEQFADAEQNLNSQMKDIK